MGMFENARRKSAASTQFLTAGISVENSSANVARALQEDLIADYHGKIFPHVDGPRVNLSTGKRLLEIRCYADEVFELSDCFDGFQSRMADDAPSTTTSGGSIAKEEMIRRVDRWINYWVPV